jgi:hypothetical protein
MAAKRSGSRSDAQRASEQAVISEFAQQEGIPMVPRELRLEGCRVKVDGYYESADGQQIVIAEAWAHIGKAVGAQPKKVLTDVLKLAFVARRIRGQRPGCAIRLFMLFIDDAAAKTLSADCWGGAAASDFRVTPRVISIDALLVDAVSKAQVAQNLMSV